MNNPIPANPAATSPVNPPVANPIPVPSTPAAPITQPAAPTQTTQVAPTASEESIWEQIQSFSTHPILRRIVAIGLTIQGLYGLFISIKFVLIDFPLLEEELTLHSITQTEVNNIAVQAILIIFGTILSMFFALKITVIQNKAAKALNTFIAVALFLGNAFIYKFLSSLPLVEMWSSLINNLLQFKEQLF